MSNSLSKRNEARSMKVQEEKETSLQFQFVTSDISMIIRRVEEEDVRISSP